MHDNELWVLVDLPDNFKPTGFKWVFKTKMDSIGNFDRFKAKLVSKGFTLSRKGSFRIIMMLIAHFDSKLHQMDVKIVFLNGQLLEEVYMFQLGSFETKGKEHMVCKLKKSFYALKQALKMVLRFVEVVLQFK